MALNWSECFICQGSFTLEPLRCPRASYFFGIAASESKAMVTYEKFIANVQRLRDQGIKLPPEFKFPEGITAQTLYDNSGIDLTSSDIQNSELKITTSI